MTHVPFFSVIIPTYNRASLISKTIDSVLAQDFHDFEIIVVDDGSTDNTQQILREFGDPRIRYEKKNNGERGAARNFGCSLSRGSYLNFFDSDDLMYPHHLTTAKEFIERAVNPEFFHLAYDFQDEKGLISKVMNNFEDRSRQSILFNNTLSCNGVFLRKDVAHANPFEEDRRMAASEDWELWIRMMSKFKLQFCNTITSSVVNHDMRSIRTGMSDAVILRDLLLIGKLERNPEIRQLYGSRFNQFIADRYTFFMLCLASEKKRYEVIRWGWKALRTYPSILVNKRFLASLLKL